MSFHTDAVDFVNSFVAVRNSMKGDSRDAYYDWLLKNDPAYQIAQAKKEQDKRDAAAAKAAKQGFVQGPLALPNSTASSGTPSGGVPPPLPPPQTIGAAPGMGGAIATTPPDQQGQIQGQDANRLRRGGVVSHFQAGGVQVPPVPREDQREQPGAEALTPEEIAYIRRLGEEADARSRPPPVLPSGPKAIDIGPSPGSVRSSRAGGYDPRPPADPTEGTEFAGQGAMPSEETSSGIGRWARGLTQSSPQASAVQEINSKINQLTAERQRVDPGMLAQTTGPQRAAAQTRMQELDAQIAELNAQKQQVGGGQAAAPPSMPERTPTAPTAPTQTTPVTPQPPPTTAGGAPTQPPPAQQGGMTPSEQALAVTPRLTTGNVGTGAPTTEPPPGSMPIPGAGGGGGGGPGGVGRRSGGRPKLGDQSRREAYDPTADAADPGNVGPVFAGGAVNPVQYAKIQDAAGQYDKTLAGAVSFAQFLTRRGESHPHSEPGRLALHAGVGAMPVSVAQAAVAAYDMGGRLKPPDALIRYAMGTYEILLERGQTAAANQMAFEVVQRLGLEAARHGQQAMHALRQGDVAGAAKLVQAGHRWSPDGKIMQMTPDGQYMGMYDQFTGKPTAPPMKVTPQMLLAGALGLADGTGMWNHLLQRAQMYQQAGKGTDKDAEGRAIRNRNNQLRGIRLEQLITKGNQPKVVGSGSVTPPSMAQFRQEARTTQPSSGGKTTIIRQGSTEDDGGADDVGTKDDE